MARIYGAILRKRTDQLCQPVYFPFRVKCRNTDPHCTGVQCTCVTMGQRSAVQSCAHSNPSFPQPPSNLLDVYKRQIQKHITAGIQLFLNCFQ